MFSFLNNWWVPCCWSFYFSVFFCFACFCSMSFVRWLIKAMREKKNILFPQYNILFPQLIILFPQERYFVPTTYYLVPSIYYFVPTTYYLVPSIYYFVPTTYISYCSLNILLWREDTHLSVHLKYDLIRWVASLEWDN
jgi:hypothetical protein